MRSRCWQLLRCSSVMSVIKGQLSSSTTCRRSWPHTLLLRCLIPSSVINSQWDRLWKTHTYMPKWAGYKEWASENKWTCFIIPLQKAINNKHGSNTPTHYLSKHSPAPAAEGSGLRAEPECYQSPEWHVHTQNINISMLTNQDKLLQGNRHSSTVVKRKPKNTLAL